MLSRTYNVLWVVLLAFALSACSLAPERPEVDTPTERLGEAYVGIAAAYNTTAQVLERGDITVETAEDIQSTLEDAEATASTASSLISAGEDPERKLVALEGTLMAVQRRLEEQTNE